MGAEEDGTTRPSCLRDMTGRYVTEDAGRVRETEGADLENTLERAKVRAKGIEPA
jgi:hypothetical protein